jgi:hypothetical protein
MGFALEKASATSSIFSILGSNNFSKFLPADVSAILAGNALYLNLVLINSLLILGDYIKVQLNLVML